MAQIKFLSISNKLTPHNFIERLGKHLKLNSQQSDNINLIYVEELINNRYNMRISSNDNQLFNKLRNKATKTKDGKAHFIKTKDLNAIFTIINERLEKYRIEKLEKDMNHNLIIKTSLNKGENITSITKTLNNNRIKFNYVSVRGNSCFVYLQTNEDSKNLQKSLKI